MSMSICKGEVPNVRTIRPLGELIENLDGRRVPVKESDRRPGIYPYYGASGIVDYVDKYLFDGEYILIAEDGENLRTRKTPLAFLAKGKFWVNNHAHVVRANESADTRYLLYSLQEVDFTSYLTGSTIPKLTQANLMRIPVLLPPLPEQRAIASILGALDDKIELNRRMNATLEAIARALFQSWFVDFDPVRAKAEGRETGLPAEIDALFPDRLVESELGEIPEGWEFGTILDIADLQSGGTPSTANAAYWNGDVPWVSAKDVSAAQGQYVLSTEKHITMLGVQNSSTRVLPKYTTIVTARGTVGKYCMLGRDMAMNQTNYGLSKAADSSYFVVFFCLANMIEQLRQQAYGTIFDTITTSTFKNTRIVLPPKQLHSAFDFYTASLMNSVLSNQQESTKLVDIRDTLLPKLISGELRALEAQSFIEEVPQ